MPSRAFAVPRAASPGRRVVSPCLAWAQAHGPGERGSSLASGSFVPPARRCTPAQPVARARGTGTCTRHGEMSTHPRLTLAAALALTLFGCRNEDRTVPPAETNPPTPTPGPSEIDPPRVDGDAIGEGDRHDEHHEGATREVPPPVGEADPVDPDMPEAVDPGADPKQPPPPSTLDARS